MGLNSVIAEIICSELSKFNGDDSLYEAVANMDRSLVCYLVNNRYSDRVQEIGYIKEKVNVNRIMEMIESTMSNNKGIRLIC